MSLAEAEASVQTLNHTFWSEFLPERDEGFWNREPVCLESLRVSWKRSLNNSLRLQWPSLRHSGIMVHILKNDHFSNLTENRSLVTALWAGFDGLSLPWVNFFGLAWVPVTVNRFVTNTYSGHSLYFSPWIGILNGARHCPWNACRHSCSKVEPSLACGVFFFSLTVVLLTPVKRKAEFENRCEYLYAPWNFTLCHTIANFSDKPLF